MVLLAAAQSVPRLSPLRPSQGRAMQCAAHRTSHSAVPNMQRASPFFAGVLGLAVLVSDPFVLQARAEPTEMASTAAPAVAEAPVKPSLSSLCKTPACKELLEQAEATQKAKEEGRPVPDFRPKTEEERQARRRMRYENEQEQAKNNALKKQEFARNEPAYLAKSQTEQFEFRQALADGANKDDARARAKAAGAAAFAAAMAEIEGAASKPPAAQAAPPVDEFELILKQRRQAAAERARQEEAAAAAAAAAAGGGNLAGGSAAAPSMAGTAPGLR